MITNADREDGVEGRQTNGEPQCADAGPYPRSPQPHSKEHRA